MAIHKFGRYHGDDPSSTQERIWERFSNLKKRLIDSSFCRSFVIEEKGTRLEVPAHRTKGDFVPGAAAQTDAGDSLVLEDVFGRTPAGRASACCGPSGDKPVLPPPARRQTNNTKADTPNLAGGISIPHSGAINGPEENSNLVNLSTSLPNVSSSPDQGLCAGPAVLELHSDILDFSSGMIFNDNILETAKAKYLDLSAKDGPTFNTTHRPEDGSAKAEVDRGICGDKRRPVCAFEAELKALDEYYSRERRRIHAKYGRALDRRVVPADSPSDPDTSHMRKRGKYIGQAQGGPGTLKLEHLMHECSLSASPAAFTSEELKYALDLRTVRFDSLTVRPAKIAEASFSEVFRVGGHIYKIIPFNESYQNATFFREIAAMVAMRRECGVVRLLDAFILYGAYAQAFVDAWDAFPEPENPRPSCYGCDQEYGCIVMEEGGRDLESHEFKTSREIVAFLAELTAVIHNLQVRFSFEHRDLHWGNILIKETGVSIIDYSFSRLEFPLGAIMGGHEPPFGAGLHQAPAMQEAKTIYTDLEKEEWLFTGDDAVDEQFRIYRLMRIGARGDWRAFNPSSNGLWVGYIIGKLVLKARAIDTPAEQRKALRLLQRIRDYFELHGWGASFVYLVADLLSSSFKSRRATPGKNRP